MEEVDRASAKTTLAFGLVRTPVALFKTEGKSKEAEYETAGPNGGKLRHQQKAAEAAPAETDSKGAPLDIQKNTAVADPGTDAPPPVEHVTDPVPPSAPGEFKQVLVEEGTDVEVERENVRRGIRKLDGSFVDLTDGLAQIEEDAKLDEMRVTGFMRAEQVQRERVKGSYYLAPELGGSRVLRLLYEAMRRTKRVGIVRWTKRSKQSLGVIVPHPTTKTLVVLDLMWAENWRAPNAKCLAPTQAVVTELEVDAAAELILAMAESRDSLDVLRDDAVVQREELLAKAESGKPFALPDRPEPEEPEQDPVDLIRESVDRADEFTEAA